MAIAKTGIYYIDALEAGTSWTGMANTPTVIHYNYATLTTTHDVASGVQNPALLTQSQQVATDMALHAWANVANINFVRDYTASNAVGTIIVRQSDQAANVAAGTITGVYKSNMSQLGMADILLNRPYNNDPAVGTYSYLTIMHELGHALGLKHSGNYNASGGGTEGPYLPASEDSLNATIMSYKQGTLANVNNNPTTPMIYDIAAIQHLYGANTSYNNDNTTYTLKGEKNAMTLWDGGGNDTLDASTYAGNSLIDLREGINNVTKIGQSDIWIAFNAAIENATSGAGSDILYGNALDNVLLAGAGNDVLYGANGNDTLVGGSGNDTLSGGNGNDNMQGGTGNDVFVFTVAEFVAADTVWGGAMGSDTATYTDVISFTTSGTISAASFANKHGIEVINLAAGTNIVTLSNEFVDSAAAKIVTINGGTSNNINAASVTSAGDRILVTGGSGNDTITGGAGNDTISGGKGNDVLIGGGGRDTFWFHKGEGADIIKDFALPGAGAGDIIWIDAAIYSTVAQVIKAISYNASGAVLNLGGGTVTLSGVGGGMMTADDFAIV